MTPLDPSSSTERVALPPGSYSVSYVPADFSGSLMSIRARFSAKVVSQNPFRVVVSDGRFTTARVLAVDAADAELGSRRTSESALIR